MADVNQHQRFLLQDRSYLSLVKRDITKLAETYGFSETEIGKINIVVSEMATNLVRHATAGGEILVKPIGKDYQGIEIIALDSGPGMAEPDRMMQDGTSTAGTAGEGLGAIKRLAHFFDFYSQPTLGTALLARFYKTVPVQAIKPKPGALEIGAVMVAKNGETVCGDGWHMLQSENDYFILALDGLGHGPDAHEASSQAIASFKGSRSARPAEILRQLHTDIRRSRGAVGAVVRIRPSLFSLEFCGVGNISGRILSVVSPNQLQPHKSLLSYNGTLGYNIPNTLHDNQIEWQSGRLLVLHSDGLKSRWELSRYPDLYRHDPSLIAALLYRDFTRGTDDNLVIVAKAKR